MVDFPIQLNKDGLIISLFEPNENLSTIAFETKWIDPYNIIWLKFPTLMVNAIEVCESTIMIAFVIYETTGRAGHYRTLINQLLSYLYGAVSKHPLSCYRVSHIITPPLIFCWKSA